MRESKNDHDDDEIVSGDLHFIDEVSLNVTNWPIFNIIIAISLFTL